MLKKLLILLLMIQLIFFSVGCSSSRYPMTQTIVTEYGEVFEIAPNFDVGEYCPFVRP